MNTVVYYPYINPRPDWLKLAALCWDKVYRLVPPNTYLSVPEEIEELDEALGEILWSVDVGVHGEDDEIYEDEIQDQFWRWIDAREEKLKGESWSSERSQEEHALFSMFPSKFPGGEFVGKLQERGLARVNYEPVEVPEGEPVGESAVYEQSESRRVGGRVSRRVRKWLHKKTFVEEPIVYLPKDVALHYLSLCASQEAKDGKRDLVADGEKFTDTVLHDYSVRGEVATTVLQAYLPKNFSNLEVKRIAEFRKEFAAQRLAYQSAVQSIVDEHAKVASEGELESVKRNIVELAKQKVDDTQRTYRRANQEMVVKAVTVSLTPPAIATAIGSALGIGIFGPAGIVAALSILGAKLLLDRDKANTERAKSPWSYVLDSARLP